ncbi:MAG: radical SAM family RiPP maturation amino acid epimerase [Francisellaceae bacterium]
MNELSSVNNTLSNIYADYIEGLTPRRRHELAHCKRFIECWYGDADFRQLLAKSPANKELIALAYGIEIDIGQLRTIWHQDYQHLQDSYAESETAPLAYQWHRHLQHLKSHRTLRQSRLQEQLQSHLFGFWREVQISRCNDELQTSPYQITHPCFAFELSDGCSVGCWFCGVSAASFKGYYAYDEQNSRLWRSILLFLSERFGAVALQTGFCYWASDPSDNPDYLKFTRDYYQIANFLPQTTTARPIKNIAWTKELIAMSQQSLSVPNRFSILSLKTLQAVHQYFSAEDLFTIELVMQHKQAIGFKKLLSGRILEKRTQLEVASRGDLNKLNISEDYGSIACVSGFVINMPQKRIELVSPCKPSVENPKGYIVFARSYFKNFTDFCSKIDGFQEYMRT